MSSVEYALILMLLVVASAAAWASLGIRTAESAEASAQKLLN